GEGAVGEVEAGPARDVQLILVVIVLRLPEGVAQVSPEAKRRCGIEGKAEADACGKSISLERKAFDGARDLTRPVRSRLRQGCGDSALVVRLPFDAERTLVGSSEAVPSSAVAYAGCKLQAPLREPPGDVVNLTDYRTAPETEPETEIERAAGGTDRAVGRLRGEHLRPRRLLHAPLHRLDVRVLGRLALDAGVQARRMALIVADPEGPRAARCDSSHTLRAQSIRRTDLEVLH